MNKYKNIAAALLVLGLLGCVSNQTKLTNQNVTILSIKKPNGASGYSNAQAAGLGAQAGGGIGGVAVAAVASVVSIFVNEATTDTEGIAEIVMQKDNGDKFSNRYKMTPFIDSLSVGDKAKSITNTKGDLDLVKVD